MASETPDIPRIALHSGPPTMDELRVHYPPRFTWLQLKTLIASGPGDIGLLKRNKELQCRYDECNIGIKQKYGSINNYLINHRLQWGKRDSLSLLPSMLDDPTVVAAESGEGDIYPTPEYFKADIPFNSELICIMRNDWPYSIPLEIEHSVIWSRAPIYHPVLTPPSIDARIQRDGLYGFTGSIDAIENLPSLESCSPILADWGVTMDHLIRSPSGNEAEVAMVRNAGREVHEFIKRRWKESQWETAWFFNPPRLQSTPGLTHIHVFARRKTAEEETEWDS